MPTAVWNGGRGMRGRTQHAVLVLIAGTGQTQRGAEPAGSMLISKAATELGACCMRLPFLQRGHAAVLPVHQILCVPGRGGGQAALQRDAQGARCAGHGGLVAGGRARPGSMGGGGGAVAIAALDWHGMMHRDLWQQGAATRRHPQPPAHLRARM